MKRLPEILLVGVLSLLAGCGERQSVEPTCNSTCTVITGKFTTDGRRTGLANVPLELKWVGSTSAFSTDVRRKATTTTDANGNYTLRFYISDNELKKGVYKITYKTTRNDLIINQYGDGFSVIASDIKRDTVIVSDWLLPRKARVHFVVTNPTQAAEYLAAEYGFDNGPIYGIGRFGYNSVYTLYSPSGGTASAGDAEVAANQPVELKVVKMKNGVQTTQRDTIRLAPNEVYNQQITY